MKFRQSKRKPPEGSRCDAMIGQDETLRQPHLIRCPNTATAELLGGFPAETWLCASCAKRILERARAAQEKP